MKLSIIIPTLNEEGYIGVLLESIKIQTLQPDEVIVVDCGSSDRTREDVRKHGDVKLFQEERPVGNQRSQGGHKAHGDLLLFLDADVRLDPDFLQNSIGQIKERKLSIACPQYLPYPGSPLIRAFYTFFNLIFRLSQNHRPSGAGSGIFVRKKVFETVGGFDPSYIFDDIVFIRKAGKYDSFGMLDTHIYVSDRRIRKYGILSTITTYILLSICFLFGFYKAANYVPYTFGLFQKYDGN